MDLPTLEELVGKKPVNVKQQGKWIVSTFDNGVCGNGSLAASVDVKFRNW